jgi:hypothetical protein
MPINAAKQSIFDGNWISQLHGHGDRFGRNSTPISFPLRQAILQLRPPSEGLFFSRKFGCTNSGSSTRSFTPPVDMSSTVHRLAANPPSMPTQAAWSVSSRASRLFRPKYDIHGAPDSTTPVRTLCFSL